MIQAFGPFGILIFILNHVFVDGAIKTNRMYMIIMGPQQRNYLESNTKQ
jgi:hypothetical protein